MTGRKRPDRPRLLVVTPVFDEEAALPAYVEAVRSILLDRDDIEGHVLFVDDGSSDASWELIQQVAEEDKRFRGLRLSRNFGPHIAVSAGMEHAEIDPDIAVTIACDLQDPPEVVTEFIAKWHQGADIVWGVRQVRREPWWRISSSRMFQAALRRWAMPRGSLFTTGGFVLIDRRVLRAVQQMRETNRINFALIAWTGFTQARVTYKQRERLVGESGWTFRRMVTALYDAFVGFSTLPIRVMTVSAIAAALLAIALATFLVVQVIFGHVVPGWTSVILVPSVFFAIQFSMTAMIGEYLYRIYAEAVRRPTYFVSEDTAEDAR